jgi:hypothetical protein
MHAPNTSNEGAHTPASRKIDAPSVVIGLALLAVLGSMGVPQAEQYFTEKKAQGMSQSVAAALFVARNEAIRTGRDHVVFLSYDSSERSGPGSSQWMAPVRILDDGRHGDEGQNCRIDPGENVLSIAAERDLRWGTTLARGIAAPGDLDAHIPETGSSFRTTDGRPAPGVVFRSDGVPRAFDEHCNIGPIGSGGGAVYFTTGESDAAVVLAPMGGVAIHHWNRGAYEWSPLSEEQFAAELHGVIPRKS